MLEFVTKHIDDETRELIAEGRCRLREREGLPPIGVDANGKRGFLMPDGKVALGVVGKVKLAGAGMSMAEGVKVAAESADDFEVYTPTMADKLGLDQELADLERDAKSLIRHDQVRYE